MDTSAREFSGLPDSNIMLQCHVSHVDSVAYRLKPSCISPARLSGNMGRPGRHERVVLDPRLRRAAPTGSLPQTEGPQGEGRVHPESSRLDRPPARDPRVTAERTHVWPLEVAKRALFLTRSLVVEF